MNISLVQALVGFNHEITHLNKSTIKFQSTSIIKENSKRIVKNMGFTDNEPLIINIKIDFPTSLTPEQRKNLSSIFNYSFNESASSTTSTTSTSTSTSTVNINNLKEVNYKQQSGFSSFSSFGGIPVGIPNFMGGGIPMNTQSQNVECNNQ
jgi:DnaJ-class molecular chaperone